MSTPFEAYISTIFGQNFKKFDMVVHWISEISKMGKNLVSSACTSKRNTTLEAYISGIFCENSKKLGQDGPLDFRFFKNGQKIGVYHMN